MPYHIMTPGNLALNRNFSAEDVARLIDISLTAYKSVFPYVCVDNIKCATYIGRSIGIVEKYGLFPDKYWHGEADEFISLLTLLSSDYPCKEELLRMAEKKTVNMIRGIADHYFQRVIVMFDHVKRHHGYDILRPTKFMLLYYPDAEGMWYVYTNDVYNHAELGTMKKPLFTVPEGDLELFNKGLKRLISA